MEIENNGEKYIFDEFDKNSEDYDLLIRSLKAKDYITSKRSGLTFFDRIINFLEIHLTLKQNF